MDMMGNEGFRLEFDAKSWNTASYLVGRRFSPIAASNEDSPIQLVMRTLDTGTYPSAADGPVDLIHVSTIARILKQYKVVCELDGAAKHTQMEMVFDREALLISKMLWGASLGMCDLDACDLEVGEVIWLRSISSPLRYKYLLPTKSLHPSYTYLQPSLLLLDALPPSTPSLLRRPPSFDALPPSTPSLLLRPPRRRSRQL
ncbi:uncharacterized protein N7496_008894 [Penicillium cataractarum]|uniref:Uncharacterized protein n=1 Tax=Penicillium cataractarum TaxID=2100454 RepID=A0A9W9S158_9EURO|nr:uncharacterized protein N7496_008894 [Penicillium cataractarum]KAJ5369134.1 hypothetical protein N7496_008894 [Penicillium cataractarum]